MDKNRSNSNNSAKELKHYEIRYTLLFMASLFLLIAPVWILKKLFIFNDPCVVILDLELFRSDYYFPISIHYFAVFGIGGISIFATYLKQTLDYIRAYLIYLRELKVVDVFYSSLLIVISFLLIFLTVRAVPWAGRCPDGSSRVPTIAYIAESEKDKDFQYPIFFSRGTVFADTCKIKGGYQLDSSETASLNRVMAKSLMNKEKNYNCYISIAGYASSAPFAECNNTNKLNTDLANRRGQAVLKAVKKYLDQENLHAYVEFISWSKYEEMVQGHVFDEVIKNEDSELFHQCAILSFRYERIANHARYP